MNPKDWDKIKELLRTIIGDSADTGGDTTAGTVMGKENAIISLLTSGGTNVVKSIQRVTYVMLKSTKSGSVAISTVNPSRCIILLERLADSSNSGCASFNYTLSSDKIDLTHSAYSFNAATLGFWIVEFY